jgi:hypothetical protein
MNLTEQLFQQFSQAVSQDSAAVEDLLAAQERKDPPINRTAWWRKEHKKVSRSLSNALKRIDELEAELKALKEGGR